jgi:hypothetical protein
MKDTIVVDSINELSDLSRKLNQKSDALNATISSINQKLAKLNFGVEAWVEDFPIECDDFSTTTFDGEPKEPEASAILLGYCYVEDGWQLAVKDVTLHLRSGDFGHTYNEATDSMRPRPLLKASRELRFKAASVIPALLDEIKAAAAVLLNGIEKAEKAASKL